MEMQNKRPTCAGKFFLLSLLCLLYFALIFFFRIAALILALTTRVVPFANSAKHVLPLSCPHAPLRGSLFCSDHQKWEDASVECEEDLKDPTPASADPDSTRLVNLLRQLYFAKKKKSFVVEVS
jgi:hypothetical protein